MIHRLKTHIEPFSQVISGLKTFEVRVNDRGFRQGDTLILEEYDQNRKEFTGRRITRRVTVIVVGWGLPSDMCVMGIADPNPETEVERLRQEIIEERARSKHYAGEAGSFQEVAIEEGERADRLEKRIESIRRETAKLCGEDPETWPGHDNIALAVAAKIALLTLRITELEREAQRPKSLG